MKRAIFLKLFLLVMLPVMAHAGTSAFYINNGTVLNPQIDASNVVNQNLGVIQTATTLLFTPASTRNYTNYGIFNGSVGFEFDTAPATSPGTRIMANSFFNGPPLANGGGTVEATTWLWVIATNIINNGNLNVSASGEMKLIGTNITLNRSLLQVKPIVGQGTTQDTNQFTAEYGITDNYWQQTNMTFFSSDIYDDTTATSPLHNVLPLTLFPQVVSVSAPYPNGYGYMNTVDPNAPVKGVFITTTNFAPDTNFTTSLVFLQTNAVVQSVFVGTNDPRTTVDVKFIRQSTTNDFKTVIVKFSQMTTNVVTGETNVTSIYFSDTLASVGAQGLRKNANLLTTTSRPANYTISRTEPPLYSDISSQNENHDPDSIDLYDPDRSFTNVVTGPYSAYSATVDNVTSRPTVGDPITNLPGRIIIRGDVVDLTKTRIRTEGLLTVQARQLVGSSNAVVDSENISYELGSTNGNFVFKNLVKDTVSRVNGSIRAWSAVWQNTIITNTPNWSLYTNSGLPGSYSQFSPLSNNIPVREHVLILDASGLNFQSAVPVTVYSLKLHSTNGMGNISVFDNLRLYNAPFFDCFGLTLSNDVSFVGPVGDWTASIAPRLRYFTNFGTIDIFGDAHFGDDRPPYDTFFNSGYIFSAAQNISSTNIWIKNGVHFSTGGLYVWGRMGNFNNGFILSQGDIVLNIASLYLTNTFMSAGGRVVFNTTNSLLSGTVTNGSGISVNAIDCGSGFSLVSRPTNSDLLGTSIESDIPDFAEIDHDWSGSDLGQVKAGFTNNAAIGRLSLVNGETDPFFQPLVYFTGPGASNALYVDDLDLSQLAGTTNVLGFSPGFTIYYAYSQGVPADILNGACDGHLRWVTNFTGPYSSTNVMRNGTNLFPVNRGLVEAMTIDSDGDTIPNGIDPTPFDNVPLSAILTIKTSNPQVQQQQIQKQVSYDISWVAIAGGIYQVQYATNMPTTSWVPLLLYTNTGGVMNVTISDNPPQGSPQRFYRVGLKQ